ncbi:MAG: cytidylate kinase-like family protein [Lachnospiraceae bacterium]|nr:cytidylate kinase-like family protein [Lachnospiraceae bacterium]
MKSLAVESEYGSGGSEVGRLISSKLKLPYYDGKALIKAAQDFHLPIALLKNYEADEADRILYCLAVIAGQPDLENSSKTDEVFLSMQKTIERLDKQNAAIFIGHCANIILCSRGVKSVFIYASDPNDRIKRIMQRENIPKEQAVIIMEQKDSYRENYYKFWAKGNWHGWNNYDMALNTSKISVERCAEILIKEMKAEKG